MASTGAVVYVRQRFTAQAISNGATGAVFFASARSSSGKYSSTVIGAGTVNKKSMRPDVSVPFMVQGGDGTSINNPLWTNWFQYIEQTFLAMLAGPTLPQVANYVTAAQAQAIAVSVVQAAISQQVNANAQSVLTIREVVQTAALPGAAAIPIPILTPAVDSPGGE